MNSNLHISALVKKSEGKKEFVFETKLKKCNKSFLIVDFDNFSVIYVTNFKIYPVNLTLGFLI